MKDLFLPEYHLQENGRFQSNKTEKDEYNRTIPRIVAQGKPDIIFLSDYNPVMEETADFTLDKNAIDSLSSDTRIRILSSLYNRRKTNAELARELSLAAPTIRHHLEHLKDAGLIEAQEDGHKWVYFQLTPFGMAIFNPDKKVRLSIILSAALTFCTALVAMITYISMPRLDILPWYPGFDDPFLLMFIVAVVAGIAQCAILVSVLWGSRTGLR